MQIQRAKLSSVRSQLERLKAAGIIDSAAFQTGMATVEKEYAGHKKMQNTLAKKEVTKLLAANEIDLNEAMRRWHALNNEISPCYACKLGFCQWKEKK